MTDSLKIIHDTIFIKGAEAYDLVNKVDAFYQSAWMKLVCIGGLIIAAIPIILTLIQRLEYKRDILRFKGEIKEA